MIHSQDSACSCRLPDGAWGDHGWHFYRVTTADYCWKARLTTWHQEQNADLVEFCACTSETRRRLNQGPVEILRQKSPSCCYQGQVIAFERCPGYYSKPIEVPAKDGGTNLVTFNLRPTRDRYWWRLEKFSQTRKLEDDLTR